MPLDPNFFNMAYSKGDWQRMVGNAAQRLQGTMPGDLSDTAAAVFMSGQQGAQASRDGAASMVRAQNSAADRMVAAERGGADEISDEVADLRGVEMANLGVNIVQTATLAYGMYKIHAKMGEMHSDVVGHLTRLEQLAIDTRLQAEQQTAATQAILKVLTESRRNEANQLVSQGERNERAGFIDEALDRLSKALEFDNTDPVAWHHIALLQVRKGDEAKAEDAFQRAVTFAQSYASEITDSAVRSHAPFMAATGRYRQAADLVEAQVKAKAREDWYEVAIYRLLAGQTAQAQQGVFELLASEHADVVVFAADPRVTGEARRVLDGWLEIAHREFLGWVKGVAQKLAELGIELKSRGAPERLR